MRGNFFECHAELVEAFIVHCGFESLSHRYYKLSQRSFVKLHKKESFDRLRMTLVITNPLSTLAALAPKICGI